VVTEEDLGSGFLFREEEGAVGQEVRLYNSFPLSSFPPLHRISPTIIFVTPSIIYHGGKRTDMIENNSSNTPNPISKPLSIPNGPPNTLTIRPRSNKRGEWG